VSGALSAYSIGRDIKTELAAASRGDISKADAVFDAAAKTAIGLVPVLVAPLGPVVVPLSIVAQKGGRVLVDKVREADREIERQSTENTATVKRLNASAEQLRHDAAKISSRTPSNLLIDTKKRSRPLPQSAALLLPWLRLVLLSTNTPKGRNPRLHENKSKRLGRPSSKLIASAFRSLTARFPNPRENRNT